MMGQYETHFGVNHYSRVYEDIRSKPIWIKRVLVKWLLGWEWRDRPDWNQ